MNSTGLEASGMIIGFYSYTEYFIKFFLLYSIKKTKNTILCDFWTGMLIVQWNESFVQYMAYKCWIEFMREELNKITVRRSLTSEMKDTPICSWGFLHVQITIL